MSGNGKTRPDPDPGGIAGHPATLQTLAIFRDYGEMQRGIRDRSAALRVSRAELDARAGFADGHASKLLAPVPSKKFGPRSLFPTLTALGCAIALIIDPDAAALIQQSENASDNASEPNG